MQKDRINPGNNNNSAIIKENGGNEIKNEEKNCNNTNVNQEKGIVEEKKIKKGGKS